MTNLFIESFRAVRGHAHAVVNEAGAVDTVARIVRDAASNCVALAALPDSLAAAIKTRLESEGVEVMGPAYESATLPLALDRPTIGITGAAFGIAQTGTLAEVCTDDAVRLVSGLPRTHIGIVWAGDLVDTLHDAAPRLRELLMQQDRNVTVSFLSGPSRTGDIELVLTLGVHGPEIAHAIIIGDGA